MQEKAASSAGMRRARGAASALLARRDRAARHCDSRVAARSVTVADRAGGALPADVCAHTVAHRSWCLTVRRSDTWPLSPPDEDQNTCDRRLPLVWRRCIHAATDTVVRRPHGRLPGDRLARLDLLARRRLAEEAPGHTAPKLRGAHARNSAQGVLMRRQTWRTPDVAATLRPMVRNAPRWARAHPAWRRGTNFFKQNYCRFHLVCLGKKFGERNFFWAWYKLKVKYTD